MRVAGEADVILGLLCDRLRPLVQAPVGNNCQRYLNIIFSDLQGESGICI